MTTDRARELHPRDRLTVLLAQHQRLTDSGKCTCGYQGVLGEIFHGHITDAILAAGWLDRAGVRAAQAEALRQFSDSLNGHTGMNVAQVQRLAAMTIDFEYADAVTPTAEPEPKCTCPEALIGHQSTCPVVFRAGGRFPAPTAEPEPRTELEPGTLTAGAKWVDEKESRP